MSIENEYTQLSGKTFWKMLAEDFGFWDIGLIAMFGLNFATSGWIDGSFSGAVGWLMAIFYFVMWKADRILQLRFLRWVDAKLDVIQKSAGRKP